MKTLNIQSFQVICIFLGTLAGSWIHSSFIQAQPVVTSHDKIVIDPGFWDPVEQNAVIFGTSATLAFDPRDGQEKLFVLTHISALSSRIVGDTHRPGGTLFNIRNGAWSMDNCREDAVLFIIRPDQIETPMNAIPELLDADSAIRMNSCTFSPIGLLGWHYGPGNLVDVVQPQLGLDLAFTAASKSPDAFEFSQVVLFVSDANKPGVGPSQKFRKWDEIELIKVADSIKDDLLIPEVVVSRTPSKIFNNGASDVVRWSGFAQVWSRPDGVNWRFGSSRILIEHWVDTGAWITRLHDGSGWRVLNNQANNTVDFHPQVFNIGFPKDIVFNPIADRWELWTLRLRPHLSQHPPGCQLGTFPYQNLFQGQWVDNQRGESGVTIGYREVDLNTLSFGSPNELRALSGFRDGRQDYPTGRQGAGVVFIGDQAYLYSAHRDRNICTLPSSAQAADTDQDGDTCEACYWVGLYTTVERIDYLESSQRTVAEIGTVDVERNEATVVLGRQGSGPLSARPIHH